MQYKRETVSKLKNWITLPIIYLQYEWIMIFLTVFSFCTRSHSVVKLLMTPLSSPVGI